MKDMINAELFTWELYESNWWYLFDLDFVESMDIKNMIHLIDKYSIGYCDGSRLIVRPNSDSYGVMFEKEDNKFWFHIEKWIIKEIEELY